MRYYGEYGGHFYLNEQMEKSVIMGKLQLSVDRTGHAELIHPHKYGGECKHLIHIRIAPHEEPKEVRVINGQDFGVGANPNLDFTL